ncbi:MAG TPA: phosphoenolpyruvate synthase [Symbiobacteriaceae bacterium]|nr:phosphoenolpyruvate synthase [Symbiobacteriaceae bacterium]
MHVLDLQEIDRTKQMVVGGKAANLGELSRIAGVRVPDGFCVTTEAYKKTVGQHDEYQALLEQLSLLKVDDREKVAEISGKIRRLIEGIEIARDIAHEIMGHLAKLGEEKAYAVRSSATSEDLPLASFAGQQDTYLNIIGKDEILRHTARCWASLFTDRAVVYRIQNGFDHRKVSMAVVIQRMVLPQAAGVLFTADPVTANRRVLSIDASFGLGEALVSGLVNPDIYKVRDGRIVEKKISAKQVAVFALPEGGTAEREIEPELSLRQTLTDEQILQLEDMGRKIEAHFGSPQDIEWCMDGIDGSPDRLDLFYIVQSRPITTLFPVPENDGQLRVYVSVAHQQMMTDAMRPLGLSIFGFLYEGRPFYKAGGRLFLDLTHDLASPETRNSVLGMLGRGDPLIKNALISLTQRKGFMESLPRGKGFFGGGPAGRPQAMCLRVARTIRKHPAIVQDLIAQSEASIRDVQQRIANVSGNELFAFILQDQVQLKATLFDPRNMPVILAGQTALYWLNTKMEEWLGERSVADTLSQSVANNVTSDMGLALLDVADVVRQYPAVIEYLRHASAETFFDDLAELPGGDAVTRSLQAFLDKYGMRCSGEIDITRTRWSERPTALIPMLLSHIRNFEPNASRVKFEQGRLEAAQKERELLSRLEQLPDGRRKAKKTKKMISLLREFIGYREYPKYAFIQRYWIYKQALLKEAAVLAQNGCIREKEDIYYLSFEELREVVRTNELDYSLITRRREEHEVFAKLMPPRVMTSEGEVISGEALGGNIPLGALAGIPVSAGIIEGRARVILKMEDAAMEDGDILVTRFTDPSWTPLFVSVRGLVTEVGGLMTHGAVIAREYGLPAVVSVENATKLIKDGQRIRVNGTDGYVEVL